MHVRVYCTEADKLYGCKDMGPLDLLDPEREPPSHELPAVLAGALKGRGLPWD